MPQIVCRVRSARLIMIDWSGVISDDQKVAHAVNNLMLADYGYAPVSYDDWRQHTSGGSWKEFFAARGIHDTDALAASFEHHFECVAAEGIKPRCYPDALRFLETASKNRTIVVISSHRGRFLLEEFKEYGLKQYIHTLYGSVHDKTAVMCDVMRSTNIRPEEAMYVADMSYDVLCARRAGVYAVSVATGYHSREQLQAAKPDLLVDSLTELRTFFV